MAASAWTSQLVEIGAMIGEEAHADAGRDIMTIPLDRKGLLQRVQDL
jgi:hypothetical protein